MSYDWLVMCALFLFGLAGTACVIPWVKRKAVALNIVSAPGGRRMHRTATPLMGGVAIFIPLAVVFIGMLLQEAGAQIPNARPSFSLMLSLFIGTAWMLTLGTLDDATRLGWRRKLLGQVFGASILVVGGHGIETATLPLLGPTNFGAAGPVLFMLIVVAVTNAINLIDGIDGLAGGICFFAALTCGVIAVALGDPFAATIAFTTAGSLVGFLLFNFPPASIFMGDGGSMSTGFLLAALATSSAAVFPGQRLGTSVMILIPFLPFGIPLFEVGLSVTRRWLRGQAIFLGDGDHLHHRVTRQVTNPVTAVLVFYVFSAALCVLTLSLVLGGASDTVRTLMASALVVVIVGFVASLSLYRVEALLVTVRNRPHFKFLGSYLWFMRHKIEKTRSAQDLLGLLESGVRDLAFDSVEVLYQGAIVEKWANPSKVHPGNPRSAEDMCFDDCSLVVRWERPLHEDEAYNEYLRLTWHRFLNALAPKLLTYSADLASWDEGKTVRLARPI
jgi:UDP-GlcNAc:undecaprenyl-phosphate/decaprenyl-phosphate GlcNAc-1-phosphate transferase